MIKIRLLKMLKNGTKHVFLQILWQWLGLVAQIIIVGCVARIISKTFYGKLGFNEAVILFLVALFGVIGRIVFDRLYTESSFEASADVKTVIRKEIYDKLLRLGTSYRSKVSTAAISQMIGEGVEQLEVYFGKYISQFIYALLAPITLFALLSTYNVKAATVLLVAVPLIPIVIMVVMKIGRKILDKYFDIYYGLGDTFLEKLHGMTTLKIYQADEKALEEMDEEAELFRRITMKVLSMQLNSTIVMDIVAYAGAAIGIGVAVTEFAASRLSLEQMLMFLLLSAEFFLPMRLLGSYFHIGMNGMKAADRMFEFLDLPEPKEGKKVLDKTNYDISIRNMSFAYDEEETLHDIFMEIPRGKFISIVGLSGSGKSTIAKILRRQNNNYNGNIYIGKEELKDISDDSLLSAITTVSLDSYVFPGTVRENLLLGNKKASDEKLIKILKLTNLYDDIFLQGGLDLILNEGGSNLSGGQRQRLVIARALLKNSPIYIFDEATSNIDIESEELIMGIIKKLAKDMGKTVIFISHRLANVIDSDNIFMLQDGKIIESGTHAELLNKNGEYTKLFTVQKHLENFAGGEA